ncbi:MAG: hypothetical protein Q8K60_04430 [Parachlamydiaceae bacterium]|nr:hypothetical protein [Parachlamydiaceae bacterium]
MSHELNSMSPTEPSIPGSSLGGSDQTIEKRESPAGNIYQDQMIHGTSTQQKLPTPPIGLIVDIMADVPALEKPRAAEEIVADEVVKTKQIDQAVLNKQIKTKLLENIVSILEDHYEVAKQNTKVGEKNEDPESEGSLNYLDAVFAALKSTKEQLRVSQIEDAETAKKTSDYKIVEIEKRSVLADEQLEKMDKMKKWQDIIGFVGDVMKWLGPVLAGACLVATFLTAGLAAPLLVASSLLLAYSVVDSMFGVTAKVMEEVNKALESAMPNSSLGQALTKILIVAVAVTVIVAAVALGNAASAANVGSQMVKKAAEFMLTAMKPIAMQAVVMVITASNAIPEAAGELAGLFAGEEGAQVIETIVMILQLIAVTMAMLLIGKGSSKPEPDVNLKPKLTALEKVKELADSMLQKLKELPAEAKGTVVDTLKVIRKMFSSGGAMDILSGIKSMEGSVKFLTGMQLITILIDASASTASGLMNVNVARLYNQVGDIKSEDEMLAGYQKSMDQLINTIYTGMEQAGQSAETVQDDLNSLIFGFGQSVQNLSSSSYRG